MPKKQRYLCVFWVIYNFHSRKWSLVYMCRSFTFLKRMVFVRWFNHCFLVHSFFGFAPWLSSCSPQWGCASNKPLQPHTWCRPKDTRAPGPQGPRWDANFISENLRKISGIRDSVQLAPVIPVIPVTIWLISSPLDFYGFLRRKIQGPDGFSILPDSANILGFSRTGPPRSP